MVEYMLELIPKYAPVCFAVAECFTHINFSCPPTDSIGAEMFVWWLRGKIIRTVLCCIVYNSCALWYICTRMWTVLKFACWFRFRIHFGVCLGLAFCVFLCLLRSFYFSIACFYYVGYSFFYIKPKYWLGGTSPTWPILCWVGRKILINQNTLINPTQQVYCA